MLLLLSPIPFRATIKAFYYTLNAYLYLQRPCSIHLLDRLSMYFGLLVRFTLIQNDGCRGHIYTTHYQGTHHSTQDSQCLEETDLTNER